MKFVALCPTQVTSYEGQLSMAAFRPARAELRCIAAGMGGYKTLYIYPEVFTILPP